MKFICLALILCASLIGVSNVTVYFNYGVFNSVNSKSFLETYMTISGNSVKYLPKALGLQASVTISWKISKGTEVVKKLSYNLLSPKSTDSLNLPSFIDSQRFFLPNGDYTVEFEIIDNAFPEQKTTHTEKIKILFNRDKRIDASDIQILESFTKSTISNNFTKSGYELVPYTINYFPNNKNTLKFYFESYNADTLLGNNSKFVYTYYVENSETLSKLNKLTGFQKQKANKVNPLLAQFDISTLPTGNYNLVIELRDSTNTIHCEKKWFFQRQSLASQISEKDMTNTIDAFFHGFNSTDSLKEFIECLWPISKTTERTWQQVQIDNKNATNMQNYLIEFWKNEARDSLDPFVLWRDYYKEVLVTKAMMKCGKQKGYYTDRGRVYLQYGKPDQRNQVSSSANVYPYEIWQYYRLYDKATKHFFTNKKFVFVNFAIADECYELIFSEVRGEKNDPNWKYRLVKRTQKPGNIDDNKPAETYGNNFDDNFLNPK